MSCLMRHPMLRILVALLIGVWSPLCCCQASVLAGTACGTMHRAEPVVQSLAQNAISACCHRCDGTLLPEEGGSTSDGSGSVPTGDPPGSCPSCPTCQGLSNSVGLQIDAKFPSLDQQWNALATLALAVLFRLAEPEDAIIARMPPWWGSPPHIKANREALRWHCALVV